MDTATLVLAGLPLVVGGGILVLFLFLSRVMPGLEKKGKAAVQQAEAAAVSIAARGPEYVRLAAKRILAYRRGVVVLVGLGVLTALEFIIAQATGSIVPMFIIGLGKAALILYYFMHLTTVWSEEAH